MRQLTFDGIPPVAPSLPAEGTAMQCLRVLLSGCALDCEGFYSASQSMRLPAYINTLERLGWPILRHYENRGGNRNYAVYSLDLESLAEVRALLNATIRPETMQ